MGKGKLFTLTSESFRAPFFVDGEGKLVTRPACNIPLIHWPDGSWCHSGNSYMRELFELNRSRRNRGGTLAVEASNITHLLRYCWKAKIALADLTDNQFCEFIKKLQDEKHSDGSGKIARETASVLAVGRSAVALLSLVGRQNHDTNFVGAEGRIRAEIREKVIRAGSVGGRHRGKKTISYWHHRSFPNPDPVKSRAPVSHAAVEGLRGAVHRVSRTGHLRLRRYALLKALEVTGGRRGEIAALTVEAVRRAAAMENPRLRMLCLKKRSEAPIYRLVPIGRSDIDFFLHFINTYRRTVVRRTIGVANDHGFVFINDNNGKPLKPDTVTDELRVLAIAAGIRSQACPHMFRHRFITKIFVALLEQHDASTPDSFRRILVDSEALKRKLMEWTGHSSMDSLNTYLDLAFDEVSKFKESYDLVSVSLTLDSFVGTIEQEILELETGSSPQLAAARLVSYAKRLQDDIRRVKTNARASAAA